jgi:hypothetical protein
MTTMTTSSGYPPYPKVTGVETGAGDVARIPTEQDKMNRCQVCGQTEEDNPAHEDDYSGPGKHKFRPAAEEKSLGDDMYVTTPASGMAIKSLGGGRFAGYMIRHTSAADPDLTNDYFTKSTERYIEVGDTIPVLYDHGLDPTLKRTRIGRATVKDIDDVGVWIEGQLKLRDGYEKSERVQKYLDAIDTQLIRPGKAGLSTGAASHMVERKKSERKGVSEITAWGVAEVSITPMPTEPRAAAMSVKSLREYAVEPEADARDFLKAVWSGKHKNDLPDSAFAFIESGGSKDSEGKTTPRSLRHFPIRNSAGDLDASHVRNALGRIPQSDLSDDDKQKALAKVKAAAKELGIGDEEQKSLMLKGSPDQPRDDHGRWSSGGGDESSVKVINHSDGLPHMRPEYYQNTAASAKTVDRESWRDKIKEDRTLEVHNHPNGVEIHDKGSNTTRISTFTHEGAHALGNALSQAAKSASDNQRVESKHTTNGFQHYIENYSKEDAASLGAALSNIRPPRESKSVGKMVEEGNFYRYRLRDPSDFEQDSFRTITLGNAGGKAKGPKIQAVVGKLKGEDAMTLQTYMFPTDEWDEDDVQRWVDDHKDKKSLAFLGWSDIKGSPDQPRDDHGRWTSGGGDDTAGGDSVSVGKFSSPTPDHFGTREDNPEKPPAGWSRTASDKLQRYVMTPSGEYKVTITYHNGNYAKVDAQQSGRSINDRYIFNGRRLGGNEMVEWDKLPSYLNNLSHQLSNLPDLSRKSMPGSTLALPHKPHQYMGDSDGRCKVCGKAEDDPLHEEAAKRLSRPLKTLFEEELAQISPSVWTLQSARDNVLSDIAAAKLVEGVAGTPVDVQGKVTECMTEYAARFIPLAVAQINDWVEDQSEPGSDSYNNGRFYLRSINIHSLADLINDDATKSEGVPALRLADHSARTVSAVEEFATITTRLTGAVKGFLQRVSDRMEFRRNQPTTKSGRVLSKENSDRLRELHASLGSAIDDAKEMHGHLGDLIERANSKYASDNDGDEQSKKALADEWETRLMVLNAEVDTELALAGTH